MKLKTVIAFWAAVATAVFLLGGIVSSIETATRHLSVATLIVLASSLIGSVIAWTIAGRVLLVVGRAQRQSRPNDSEVSS